MASSVQGVSGFIVKQTAGAEWGLYRFNLSDYQYLVLAFGDIEEAISVGKTLVELLGTAKDGNKKVTLKLKIDRSEL